MIRIRTRIEPPAGVAPVAIPGSIQFTVDRNDAVFQELELGPGRPENQLNCRVSLKKSSADSHVETLNSAPDAKFDRGRRFGTPAGRR